MLQRIQVGSVHKRPPIKKAREREVEMYVNASISRTCSNVVQDRALFHDFMYEVWHNRICMFSVVTFGERLLLNLLVGDGDVVVRMPSE